MRRGRVQSRRVLDFDEPQPRAFEQLVTVGRRRCCAKPSRQLAQLYRSFFISHRLTSPRGPWAARRAGLLKAWNGRALGNLRSDRGYTACSTGPASSRRVWPHNTHEPSWAIASSPQPHCWPRM